MVKPKQNGFVKTGAVIKETVSKVVERPPIDKIEIWCTACSANYSANKKDNKGELTEQQLCPHTILKKVKYNA